MKSKISIILFSTVLLLQALCVHAYQQQAEVLSSGGGSASVGNYTHFSVMGEPIVQAPSISGTLEASIGFIYQTVTQLPLTSATVFTDMDITTTDLIEPQALVALDDESWIAIAAQDVNELSRFTFDISFDPTKVQYLDVSEDHPLTDGDLNTDIGINLLKQNGGLTSGFEVISIDNETLRISNFIIDNDCETFAVDGAGPLAFLKFEIMTEDDTIPLSLSNVIFTNCDGDNEAIANTENGAFVIEADNPSFKIKGHVSDVDGNPIPGMLIEVEGVGIIDSNNDGYYEFNNLTEEGTYTATISSADSDSGDSYIFTQSSVTVTLDVDNPVAVVDFQAKGDLPGDLNDDGVVDRSDVDVIMSFNRQSADVCPPCDIDGDGFITLSDAIKLEDLCDCDNCFCE